MLLGGSLLTGIKYLIPLILSLTVHEWAHAYSAFRLGDGTLAASMDLSSKLQHERNYFKSLK